METLDKHFRVLTGASFAKRGRAIGDLISQWPVVVGERLAAISVPERIRWPKTAGSTEQAGVLIVKSAPGYALNLQHETQVVIERINAFLGYGAVSGLKIIQSHKGFGPPRGNSSGNPSAETTQRIEEKLAEIGYESLKKALMRLGAGALSRGRNTPQPK